MLKIADIQTQQKNRQKRPAWSARQKFVVELWLPILLFGSTGAIAWAIRGSGGWGGIDGTIVPGLTWGLLWHYLSSRKGPDSRSLILPLGLGIAIGGELGYGQYITWIKGIFQVGAGMPVFDYPAWQGYLWLFICGVAWGGLGGVILGWALNTRLSLKNWLVRFAVPFAFAAIGWGMNKFFPTLFFPHYSPELYTPANCPYCDRTLYTNTQNFIVFMWWFGALLTAILQKDKTTQVMGALLGVGFGIVFAVSAAWTRGYDFAPAYIDWWKVWEMSSGFGLGALYAIALYWVSKNVKQNPASASVAGSRKAGTSRAGTEKMALLSFYFSWALLLFILFRGASYRFGVLLGLYAAEDVNQYAWPMARVFLFAPVAFIAIVVTLKRLWRSLKILPESQSQAAPSVSLYEKTTLLLVGVAFVGVAVIWPSKIGVFYVAFLWLAIYSLNRLAREKR